MKFNWKFYFETIYTTLGVIAVIVLSALLIKFIIWLSLEIHWLVGPIAMLFILPALIILAVEN